MPAKPNPRKLLQRKTEKKIHRIPRILQANPAPWPRCRNLNRPNWPIKCPPIKTLDLNCKQAHTKRIKTKESLKVVPLRQTTLKFHQPIPPFKIPSFLLFLIPCSKKIPEKKPQNSLKNHQKKVRFRSFFQSHQPYNQSI